MPRIARVAVLAGDSDLATRRRATALAKSFGVPAVEIDAALDRAYDVFLVVARDGLRLRRPYGTNKRTERDVRVNFRSIRMTSRATATAVAQPLAAAIGLRRGIKTVFDATAGFGMDAFQLAALGCKVTAVERNAVLHALLADAMGRVRREAATSKSATIIGRIELIQGDAREILSNLSDRKRPDAVFMDPMYPPRGKAIETRKEMQICRLLVGNDEDAAALLDTALRSARRRVVVKRHRKAEPLGPTPALTFRGTTVRYDVYAGNQLGGK